MSTSILVILCLSVGVAIGFVLCALLQANGNNPDPEADDTKRLDFIHQNTLHLAARTSDHGTAWGVVGPGGSLIGTVADSARGAIDIARANWRAP